MGVGNGGPCGVCCPEATFCNNGKKLYKTVFPEVVRPCDWLNPFHCHTMLLLGNKHIFADSQKNIDTEC